MLQLNDNQIVAYDSLCQYANSSRHKINLKSLCLLYSKRRNGESTSAKNQQGLFILLLAPSSEKIAYIYV